jgi:hypothetical protein
VEADPEKRLHNVYFPKLAMVVAAVKEQFE